MDLISIIVPVYNAEKYLKRCVDSIRNQSFKTLEIILVDDGSQDNSGKMCDEFALEDERIKVIHKINGGVSEARNFGIEAASGKYIGFVDSDDYIDEDMYEILYKEIISNDADLSVISIAMVREDGEKINGTDTKEKIVYEKKEILQQLLLHTTIKNYSCDKLYKKTLFDEIRFPIGITYEDIPTIFKVMKKANKIVYIDAIKYFYVKHKGTISSNCSEKNVNNYLDAIIFRYKEIENYKEDIKKYNLYAIANATIHAYYKVMLSNISIENYREKLNFLIDKCIFINKFEKDVIELFSIYQKACFYMLLNDEELFISFLRERQKKNRSNSAN